ncbi:cytochrome P450 [Nocardioides daeguensis]|uniref:Cytochrome P450 n=1 Tax=Nocardioides daeguensis TaxID=908359 RepID=A0ABP6V1R7_9ACTN|nr:cytochrome P450 [Nocardioides daeguensis]MBV6729692.1 cytochrome P450 [Nocardioides daeguensis]MCR1774703.1 cytochrome P450 [Nocardioides daeguensis]
MFDVFDVFDPALVADPYPALARLRSGSPVHRVAGTDVHLVSSWQLVQEVLAAPETYSSHLRSVLLRRPDGTATLLQMDGGGMVEQVLATADDPNHQIHRSAVLGTIGRRIRALEASVTDQVDRLWVTHFSGDGGDWARDMADRLPLSLVAELIGLGAEDVPDLRRWAYDSTEMLGGWVDQDRLDTTIRASLALHAYLAARFDAALDRPGDDLMGELALAVQLGELEPGTAVLVLLQLVGAGGESTAGLLGTAAHRLATDRCLQNRLRAEPDLLDPFLDECLRLESPFRGHYRHVLADTTLGGVALPAGSTLLLLWGAANRDPARFEEPDAVDLGRDGVRQHLAFGRGIHFCVGSALARLEATVAIHTLLTRTTSFRLDGPEDAAAVWVPSILVRRHSRLRLALER